MWAQIEIIFAIVVVIQMLVTTLNSIACRMNADAYIAGHCKSASTMVFYEC